MTSTEIPKTTPPRSNLGALTARNIACMVVFAVLAYPTSLKKPDTEVVPTPPHDFGALPNFRAVHTYLYRGGEPSERGLKQLKEMGVGTVIDLRRNPNNIALERIFSERLGLKYISLPMGNFVPTNAKQNEYLETVSAASADPTKGKVFVHCSHGSDRTGYMVALWRVKHDGWSIASAAWEALNNGFIVHKFRKDEKGKMFD